MQNAAAMRAIFDGEKNAYRDIVIFNAAAAMFGAGHVGSLIEAKDIAIEAIDSKAALTKLEQLAAMTNQDS